MGRGDVGLLQPFRPCPGVHSAKIWKTLHLYGNACCAELNRLVFLLSRKACCMALNGVILCSGLHFIILEGNILFNDILHNSLKSGRGFFYIENLFIYL